MALKIIVLFGGTFDPVHLGHIKVAENVASQLHADKVVLIPAKHSPLKTDRPAAPGAERLEMLRIAVQGKKLFEVNSFELDRPAPSYTFDTVSYFKGLEPNAEICWLVGADCLCELPGWHRALELAGLCRIVVVPRGGCPPPDFAALDELWPPSVVEKVRKNAIRIPQIDVSGTRVRALLAAGKDTAGLVAPQVAEYISRHSLYRS